ncbi:MAG: phosphotransferase [Chloroflexi bacterium]|nr:phosphotransferase [Chloroflexota bacterium]
MTLPAENILAQAARKFGLDANAITLLRDSVNVIYQFTQGGQDYILRLTPASQRDKDMLYGEMDWMDYLAGRQGRVPQPARSLAGNMVEEVGKAEQSFLVVVFEKVPGVHPEGATLTDDVLRLWGRALGHMHRLGKSYRPSNPAFSRPHWHELDVFKLDELVPDSQPLVRQKCRETLDYMRALPTGEDSYGLIHADPEPWNFLLHQGQITFIDFDECCYHWFVFDLAVSLMYAVVAAEGVWGDDFAQHAWDCLYAGYRQENVLSKFWLRQMPAFLRLRVMEDYTFHLGLWDLDDLTQWQQNTLRRHRHVIETGEPLLNVAFD